MRKVVLIFMLGILLVGCGKENEKITLWGKENEGVTTFDIPNDLNPGKYQITFADNMSCIVTGGQIANSKYYTLYCQEIAIGLTTDKFYSITADKVEVKGEMNFAGIYDATSAIVELSEGTSMTLPISLGEILTLEVIE